MQLSFFKKCATCGQNKLLTEYHKHSGSPDGRQYSCNKCTNEKIHQWYLENKDKKKEQSKKRYRDNHPAPQWMSDEERKEHQRISHQNYYAANREKRIAATKTSVLKNPSRLRRWLENNRDKRAINEQRRRAQKANVGGDFTPDEFRALCESYGNICLRCREKKKLTIDHVIPLSKGGSNSIDNIQPLCFTCNASKGANTIDYRG